MKIKISLLCLVLLLVSGCTTDLGRFTIISTNNANTANIDYSTYKSVVGESSHKKNFIHFFG